MEFKERDALTKELTALSDQATKKVEDTACKVIESSSQQYIYQSSEAA